MADAKYLSKKYGLSNWVIMQGQKYPESSQSLFLNLNMSCMTNECECDLQTYKPADKYQWLQMPQSQTNTSSCILGGCKTSRCSYPSEYKKVYLDRIIFIATGRQETHYFRLAEVSHSSKFNCIIGIRGDSTAPLSIRIDFSNQKSVFLLLISCYTHQVMY